VSTVSLKISIERVDYTDIVNKTLVSFFGEFGAISSKKPLLKKFSKKFSKTLSRGEMYQLEG